MSKKTKKKSTGEKRTERRFVAQSSYSPWLVRIIGILGALALGAGAWGYFYGHAFDLDEKLKQLPSYLIAAGAVLTGVAIWLGTSSEMPLRVGAPGIGMERGELRRMPWWGVKQISFEAGSLCLVVAGEDESGTSWTFRVPMKAHPEAVAWIVSEAERRIPKKVDISDDDLERIPEASSSAGMKIDLEPLQVVGRKCAASGKTISYEPDGRICTRCERVYFKRSVPKKCKCGADLAVLRGSVGQDEPDDTGDDEDEDEAASERESGSGAADKPSESKAATEPGHAEEV